MMAYFKILYTPGFMECIRFQNFPGTYVFIPFFTWQKKKKNVLPGLGVPQSGGQSRCLS